MSVTRVCYVHIGNCQRIHLLFRKKKWYLLILPPHDEDNFRLLSLNIEKNSLVEQAYCPSYLGC